MENKQKYINNIIKIMTIIVVMSIVIFFIVVYFYEQKAENINNSNNINNDIDKEDDNSNDSDNNTDINSNIKNDDSNSNENTNVHDNNSSNSENIQESIVFQLIFDDINELINSDDVNLGTIVKTNGFYPKSDIGGAYYEIVKTPNMDVDNTFVFKLNNDLYAEFSEINTSVSSSQVGMKCDGETNETELFEKLLNYSIESIIIESGNCVIDENININNQTNKVITGNNTNLLLNNKSDIIINDSQNIVLDQIKIINSNEKNNINQDFQIEINNSELIQIKNFDLNIKSNVEFLELNNSDSIELVGNTINYEFIGTNHIDFLQGEISKISDNDITISGNNEKIDVFNLHGNSNITNNEIHIAKNTNNIFKNVGHINNNKIIVDESTDSIITNTKKSVLENEIIINNKLTNIINYDNVSLNENVLITNNNIENNYNETDNDEISRFLNVTNISLNDKELNISNNALVGDKINEGSYLFVYESSEVNQNIIMENNNIEGYNVRYTMGSGNNKIKYLPAVDKVVTSIDELKNNTTLENGDVVKTESFYEGNNTGGSYYKIIDSWPSIIYKNIETIALANGLYGLLINTGEGVSVNQFGAVGNGNASDKNAIEGAIYSGFDYIYFEDGIYRSDSPIVFSEISDVTIDGRNQVVFYDDNFDEVNNKNSYFMMTWKTSKLDFINLNVETHITKPAGVVNQIEFHISENITVKNSRFYIKEDAKSTTNIDLNTQWKNIVIDNNELLNYCDQNSGGNIWIRESQLLESSGLKFTNNKVDKISHDELLAVFLGTISDVYIAGNSFTSTFGDSRTSVMSLSFGTAFDTEISNIIFEDNYVNVVGVGALMYVKNDSDTIIRNNELIYTKELTEYNSSLIHGNAELVENNQITVKQPVGTGIHGDKLMDGKNVINNTINVEGDAYTIFEYNQNVENNIVNVEGNLDKVFYNVNNASNNEITVNGKLNNIIQLNEWFNINGNMLYDNNLIKYNYDEIINGNISTFVYMDDVLMNNNSMTIINNTIEAPYASNDGYIYNINIADSSKQYIFFENNIITEGKYKLTNTVPIGVHDIILNKGG